MHESERRAVKLKICGRYIPEVGPLTSHTVTIFVWMPPKQAKTSGTGPTAVPEEPAPVEVVQHRAPSRKAASHDHVVPPVTACATETPSAYVAPQSSLLTRILSWIVVRLGDERFSATDEVRAQIGVPLLVPAWTFFRECLS